MAKAVGTVVGATVGFFIGGPVGAIAGAGLGYAGGAVVEQALNPGYDIPDLAARESQDTAGILLNKEGTDNYIPVVYGVRYVGGTRVHMTTESANNQFLYVKQVFCEGQIDRINAIYLDETLAIVGTSLWTSKFSPYTAKNKDNADITITPLTFANASGKEQSIPTPSALWGPGWTQYHTLEGLAYTAFKYQNFPANNQDDSNKNPFVNGIPNVVAEIYGKKVLDISLLKFYTDESRTTIDTTGAYYQSTNGRSGYDPNGVIPRESIPVGSTLDITFVFSRNPVLCLFDYLTNKRYGKGLELHQIDLWSFKLEANRWYRDSNGNIVTAARQHNCDAVIDTSRTVFENVENMLFNMNATLPFVNGRFTLRVEDNRSLDGRMGGTATSVMTVNENNIIGGISIESESTQSKYNRVVVSYPGGEFNEMREVYYPTPGSVEEATYLAEDNGRVNELRLSYEHFTSASIAGYKAQFALNKSRFRGKVINFTGDASLNQLTVGDIFTFTYSNLGINALFRVRQIQFNPDYTFNVVAEEHNETLYGVPVAAAVPRDIYRNFSTNAQPIYIKNSDPQVVFVGDYNTSSEAIPMTQLLDGLSSDWGTYVTDNFNVATTSYTTAEIEEGLQDGTITRWINADLLIPGTELSAPPEIVSTEYIINTDNANNSADVIINLKADTNINITETKLLVYDYQQRAYKAIFVPEADTAAARGQITIKNYPLGVPFKYIVQYKTRDNKISSQPQTLDISSYYRTNKIQAAFLDTPLYSLDNGTQWNSTAIDSSTLQWSETGTWITGVPEATTHQTIVYTTDAIDLGERINAYPETTVLFDTNSTTPGNLKISYLVSEDNTTYYEVPYNLMPLVDPTYFSAFTDPPYSGFQDNNFEIITAFSGPPRYYKTRVTLQQGEFYGVQTKWRTDTITKILSNQNMYSILWIEDEDTYPDCDSARLYKRPVGSTRSEYALTATGEPDYIQDFVAVGGTPDLSAVSLFTGNLVASVIPDNNFKFSHITSLTGKTALEDANDDTPQVTMTASGFKLEYTVGGGNIFLTFNETENGNYYLGILPYMPLSPYENGELPFEGIAGDQSVYTFQTPWAINDADGHKIRLWISGTDQEIVFQDIDDDNNEIHTGPLKMNWTFTGYPLLAFDEEQGVVKPVEDV
jgi:hypothetical protein